MHYVKTAMLLAVLTAIFMALGFFIGGTSGMLIALGVALVMNFISYWNSDKIVLRMHGAVEVDARTAPELYSIVRQLAENAELPMPRVYVMHTPQPNAFATGRDPDHAAVAATTGLLDILSREEIAGVIAHELAHIKSRDTLIMTITATIAGAISMLAQFGFWFGGGRSNNNPLGWVGVLLAALVAPFAAMLVQMAISRVREYRADRLGAEIVGRPLWLASALRRISSAAAHTTNRSAEEFPATAHLFIVNPLTGDGLASLFRTHPPTESRVARLEELAREWQRLDAPNEPMSEDYAGPWSHSRAADDRQRFDDDSGRGPWG